MCCTFNPKLKRNDMKFTFKTNKPTGKWKAFQNANHEIKLGGRVCGLIEDELPHKIRFMKIKADIMEDGNHNCEWMWVKLKKEFPSLDEAKKWISENSETILKQINIFRQ